MTGSREPGARGRTAAIVVLYGTAFFLALPALLVAVGRRLDRHLGWDGFPRSTPLAGWIVASVGIGGVAWTMLYLARRGRGWPISHLPPTLFVARGPYRVVRHPIYVAFTLVFIGAGLAIGSPGLAFAASGLLTAGWVVYVLGFEEPKLVERFGTSYREYRGHVPIFRVPGRHAIKWVARAVWSRCLGFFEAIANHVVLFRVGPSVWVTYGALLAAGALGMGLTTGGLLVEGGWSSGEAGGYLISLALAMLVAARVIWLGYQWRALRERPVAVLRTVGFVSWGGILGSLAWPFLYGATRSVDPLWLLDRTLLGLVVCAIPGRLACLTYGCCFGRPCERGITWTHPAAKVNRSLGPAGPVPRVPTQLIEAGWLIVVLAVGILATRAAVPAGAVSGIMLVLYGVGRFAGDCLREEDRFGAWGLTAGQIGAVAILPLGIALILATGGGAGWSAPATVIGPDALIAVWPYTALCAALVFAVAGFHWRRVGTW